MPGQSSKDYPNHQIDVLIAFPPYSKNTHDSFYPAPYVLAEYAKSKGLDARVWDINHSIVKILIEGGALKGHINDLSNQIDGFEQKRRLTPAEAHRYRSDCLADIKLRLACLKMETALRMDKQKTIPPEARFERLLQPLLSSFIPSADTRLINFRSRNSIKAAIEAVSAKRFESIIRPQVEDTILTWLPRVLGVSIAFMPQFIPAMIIARLVRVIDPNIHICLGGPTISLMPDAIVAQILNNGFCDTVIRQEGEVPFIDLVMRIRDSKPYDDIPEIESPRNQKMNQVPSVHRILGWNECPKIRPEPALLAIEPYYPGQVPVIHSRGCYWNQCSFCDYPSLYSSQKFSARPIDHVLEDIFFYAKRGINKVWLTAEALPPRDTKRIAEGMLERNIKIEWGGFIRADRGFDRELLVLLARSGFEGVVGLESTNDRILGLLCKGYDGTQAKRFLDNALAAGIRFQQINIIVDVPTTTYKEALEVFETVYRYKSVTKRICDTPFELTLVSKMARNPAQFGIQVLGQDRLADGLKFGTLRFRELTGGMSQEERGYIDSRYREANEEICLQLATFAKTDSPHSDDWVQNKQYTFPHMSELVSRPLYFTPYGTRLKARTLVVQCANGTPVTVSGSALEILETLAGKTLDRSEIEKCLIQNFRMTDVRVTVDLFLELCKKTGLLQSLNQSE